MTDKIIEAIWREAIEAAAALGDRFCPATQDMTSTMICEAIEAYQKAILALLPTPAREGETNV